MTNGPRELLEGFRLLVKPGIRLYVVIPFLLNSLLFSGIIFFGAHHLGTLIDWLTSNWSWTEWISWLLWPLFVLVSLTIVFFCFSIVANLIAAPFNGLLAEAVAGHLQHNKESSPFSFRMLAGELKEAFKSEATKLVYFAIRALPLLLLFFIPLVQAFAPFIWFLFGAWMLALEYMEYPMGNEGMHFSEVRSKLSERRFQTLSFGASVMVLTMIPVLNFIVMPAAVAAATRVWTEKLHRENDEGQAQLE